MSDTKEIEQVIEQLELDGHHELVTAIKIKYSSLITTIESLQSKIEVDSAFARLVLAERNLAWHQLESLQEKLDLQTEPVSEVAQFWVDACAAKDMEISKLESEQKGHLHSLFLKRQEIESQNTIIIQQQEAIKYWQNDSKLSQDCSARKEGFIKSQKIEITLLSEELNAVRPLVDLGMQDKNQLIESLEEEVESQKEICELYDQAVSVVKQQANVIELKERNYRKLFSEFQSQKEEIDDLESRLERQRELTSEEKCANEAVEKDNRSLKAITELKNEMLQDAETRILAAIEARDKLQGITELAQNELSVKTGQLELAVKGLEKISIHCAVYRYPILEGMTDATLSEIEGLKNAQT